MNRNIKKLVSVLLCLVLAASMSTAAFAGLETTTAPEETGSDTDSIIDKEALGAQVQALVDRYAAANSIKASQVSIAYTYLATGDTWFLNPDTWYYSASLYKVPLMMILAERQAKGELSPDSMIENTSLADTETAALVYSNNDVAHASLRYISGKTDKKESEKATRPLYMAYSDLPENYYHSDFVNYSYFSARFMNDVMETLYDESSSFPNLIDLLKQAEPGKYLRLNLGDTYQIAQKYGYYKDSRQTVWNNITGIIYTPNPILVTVMTADAAKGEQFMGEAAELFVNYTLELDSQLEAHRQQLALAQAQAEAEAKAQAEAEAQAAAEAQAKAEAEAAQRKAEQEQAVKQAEKIERADARKESMGKILKYVGYAGGAILFILVLVGVFTSVRKRRVKDEDEFDSERDDGYDDFDYEKAPKAKRFFRRNRRGDDDEDDEPDDDLDDEELDDEELDDEEEDNAPRFVRASARKTYYDDNDVNTPDVEEGSVNKRFAEDDAEDEVEDEDEAEDEEPVKSGRFKGFPSFRRGASERFEEDEDDVPPARTSRSSGGYVPKH
ncbi:MAG: serine hydrolase [Eubacteriales bacterium]|nr:serine hydrolase [Eubacteriales bacterium]